MVYANHSGVENGVQFTGRSCIVDPCGNDLARAEAGEEVISATLDIGLIEKAREHLPHIRDFKKVDTIYA